MKEQLYAIVRASTGEVVWAAVTDAETAEGTAVIVAVNGGSMNLLSGADLANHLMKLEGSDQHAKALGT